METEQKALIVYAPHRGFERRDRPEEAREGSYRERGDEDRRKNPRVDFDPLYELNQNLAAGWRVAKVSPMGGGQFHPQEKRLTESVLSFASLVILEREKE